MNVTFMIGNGFDLNLGLNTGYGDFYDFYVATPSADADIESFKKLISKNHDNWKDFELSIPDIYEQLSDYDKFEICFLNFKESLTEYLSVQEKLLDFEINKGKNIQDFKRFSTNFIDFLPYEDKVSFDGVKGNINKINYLTFNYTNNLEMFVKIVRDNQVQFNRPPNNKSLSFMVKHIHSILTEEIILGLDNSNQYNTLPDNKRKFQDYLFNKSLINKKKSDIENECVKLINECEIIVLYGWSFGESDQRWVNYIKDKFLKDKKTKIIYVPYFKIKSSELPDNKVFHRVDEAKIELCRTFGIPHLEANRIFSIVDEKYVDFSGVELRKPATV